MAQISYIKYTDVLEARRYDAEYFKPEYLEIERKFSSCPSIKDVSLSVVCGPFGSTILDSTYTQSGVEVIRPFNIKDYSVEEDNIVYISEEDVKNKNLKLFEIGDLFFARVGDIRAGVFMRKKATISPNIIGVKIDKSKQNPYFLSIFFNTKYGFPQMLREQKIVAQPTISTETVRGLKIPILPQSFQLQIEEMVKSAHQKQTQSKQLYREAEQLLLAELGLLDYQVKHSLWFTTTKNEVSEAHRYDSEYFQPKYAEIIKKIENYEGGWDFANEMVKWKKGVEVGTEAYTEIGKDFVRVSDFSIYGISEANRKISDEAFEDLKKNYQPKQGEILFTKDGTIGLSYVLKEDIQGVLSGAFLRLILKEKYQDFEKECLSLIFSSILCKMQVEKLSGGALIAHLKPSDFETFKVPLIKSSIQKQIAEKIKESHRLRKESKELLEEAKRKVEEEIEKE